MSFHAHGLWPCRQTSVEGLSLQSSQPAQESESASSPSSVAVDPWAETSFLFARGAFEGYAIAVGGASLESAPVNNCRAHFLLQLWPASLGLIAKFEIVLAALAKSSLLSRISLSSQPGVPAAGQSGNSFFQVCLAPFWGPENGPTIWPPTWVH